MHTADISIVLITFLFTHSSNLPPTLPLFLLSVSYNPSIEFRIITNVPNLPFPIPGNAQLVHMTYENIMQKLKIHLNVTRNDTFVAEYPYKMCEFKPMFGVLFAEIVEGFKFWGHIDNDLILSNLLSEDFVDPRILDGVDIMSSSNSMCNGPLQIYRNIPIVNNLYKESKDLELIVNTRKYYGFDENHGTLKNPFPKIIRRAALKGKIKWNKTKKTKMDDRFYYRHGSEKGYIWSPRYSAVLWNATGLYDIIDQKHPHWSYRAEEDFLQLVSIPGFFHLISWKMLSTYKVSKSDVFLKTLSALMYSTVKDRSNLRLWSILVSCHDVYFMNQESLHYLHTETGKFFSLETLIQLFVKSNEEQMRVCEFDRSKEYFFRRGKLPACAGGFDSYNDLVDYNGRRDKITIAE